MRNPIDQINRRLAATSATRPELGFKRAARPAVVAAALMVVMIVVGGGGLADVVAGVLIVTMVVLCAGFCTYGVRAISQSNKLYGELGALDWDVECDQEQMRTMFKLTSELMFSLDEGAVTFLYQFIAEHADGELAAAANEAAQLAGGYVQAVTRAEKNMYFTGMRGIQREALA